MATFINLSVYFFNNNSFVDRQVRDLEMDLDNEQRQHGDTSKNIRKQERRLKELTFQSEEDHKAQERMQEMIEKLQNKIKTYKRQVEEAVSVETYLHLKMKDSYYYYTILSTELPFSPSTLFFQLNVILLFNTYKNEKKLISFVAGRNCCRQSRQISQSAARAGGCWGESGCSWKHTGQTKSQKQIISFTDQVHASPTSGS